MASSVPMIPPSFKPYTLIFFDEFGKSVYSEKCGFKPDGDYVKQIMPFVCVRLLRKGKTNFKEFSVHVVESNVTFLGKVKDFLGDKHA